MQDQENLSEIKIQDQKIMENSELSIFEAMIPIIILVGLLAYNVFIFGDDSLSGMRLQRMLSLPLVLYLFY